MEPLVYIILVNYNAKEHTIECLESIKNIAYNNYKVILVDNDSEDKDFEFIKKTYKDTMIILNNDNYGFAGGNNIAIKYAVENNAKYILLLNNDTIVKKDFLNSLVDGMKKNDNIGIAVSKILYYSDRDTIWYGGGDINYIKGNSIVHGLNEIDKGQFDKSRLCTFATGCCMLINTNILDKVGMMDESYFLYYEDADYSMKISKEGYKILYCPESVIYHKESVATKKFSYNYQYYFAKNRLLFIKKNFSIRSKLSSYPITIMWLFFKIIKGEFNFSPCYSGVKDFLKKRYGRK